MSYPLDSAWAKFSRGRDYLHRLEKEVTAFINRKPYRTTYEFNPKSSKHVWRIYFTHEPPEPAWGLLVGDCIHNTRCALDHAIWALARLASGTPDDRDTQFPIFIQRRKFKVRPPKRGNSSPSARSMLRLKSRDKTFIKRLQPFNGPKPYRHHPLWLLNHLDIMDKHKFLNVSFTVVRGLEYWFVRPTQAIIRQKGRVVTGPVKNGTAICTLTVVSVTQSGKVTNVKVKVKGKPAIGIAFGKGILGPKEFAPLVETLWRIVYRVEAILHDFDLHMKRAYGVPPPKG